MWLTIALGDGSLSRQIEVTSETSIDVLSSLIEIELGVSSAFRLTCNGRQLSSGGTVGGAGLTDQDLVLVVPATAAAPPAPAAAARAAPGPAAAAGAPSQGRARSLDDLMSLQPEYMLRFFQENPTLLPQLRHANRDLAEAIESRDAGKVRTAIMIQQMEAHKKKWERETEMARLESRPDDPESQRRIEEIIRQENIEQNLAMAMEETPEAFGRVTMLYIDMEVNGRNIKAFVDSGAQMTIMSLTCAERCGLTHLIDKRFAGEARGVGTGKILGRIHMSHVKIGGTFFPCSFTILERSDVEFLLGLDQLRRHHCVLDFKQNLLSFGSTGVAVPFLGEADIPQSARGTQQEDLVPQSPGAAAAAAAGAPAASAAAAAAAAGGKGSANAGSSGGGDATAGGSGGSGPSPMAVVAPAPATAAGGTAAGGAGEADKILQLTALGFTPQQAAMALQSTGGDVEQAAGLLLMQG